MSVRVICDTASLPRVETGVGAVSAAATRGFEDHRLLMTRDTGAPWRASPANMLWNSGPAGLVAIVVPAACVALFATPQGRVAADQIARDMRRHLGRALAQRTSAWWIDQNSLLRSFLDLRQRPGIRLGNVEDAGLPFGSFSYRDSQAFPGGHPLLAEAFKSREDQAAAGQL